MEAASGIHDPSSVAATGRHSRWGATERPLDQSTPAGMLRRVDRIFVQIASYRDPECQWTINDLFDKALNPDRVFVGVVWQYTPAEDKHCFEVETRPRQVRVERFNARFSQGVCWARALAQKLWRDEEYTLQIDSHTRFEPDWDQKLIELCRQTGSPKPVISCYPPAYTPPDRRYTGFIYSMGAKAFNRDGILSLIGKAIKVEDAPAEPIPGAFCSGCFLFAPSAVIREVPYDPHLYFFGEEITLAVRLWTHGWDLFHPNMPVVYTNWDRKYRKTHFEDHADWPARHQLACLRVKHLLGMGRSDNPAALQDLDRYSLGSARTLKEYQRYSGVNFARQSLNARARDGLSFPRYGRLARRSHLAKINHAPKHEPRLVFESEHGLVFDDFLPEETYRRLQHYAGTADYERINVQGKTHRVWRLRDGFPLRSAMNLHYFAVPAARPNPKPDWAYPINTVLDEFVEHLNRLAPKAAPYIGRAGQDWDRYSVTGWIYPRDTALSLHDDGSGVYSGAFTYFVTSHWDIHWGGLLMMLDPRSSQALQKFKTPENAHDYYRKKWLDPTDENVFVWEPGLAQCIFPKRNRLVFIHPDCYHFVTRINADAGENVRLSYAGFFMKPASNP